jgi:hypothetical protein
MNPIQWCAITLPFDARKSKALAWRTAKIRGKFAGIYLRVVTRRPVRRRWMIIDVLGNYTTYNAINRAGKGLFKDLIVAHQPSRAHSC